MERAAYFKTLFFIGALWNWVAVLTFAFGYRLLFPLFAMELPRYPVFLMLFLGLAFVFGFGYYWVSRDISKNHDIVRLGVIGKLVVFVGFFWAALTGQIAWLLVGAGIVDLIFAILFIEFLISYRKAAA